MKVRLTQHSGRTQASAKHNDRNFDIKRAVHIDETRTGMNIYRNWTDNIDGLESLTFEQAELLFYEENFGDSIRKRNLKYIKSGHPEKCRSVSDIYKNQQKKPEELILQIRNIDNQIDPKVFTHCLNQYLKLMLKWGVKHGNPFTLLNLAVHLDEASPHVHIKRVWHYRDEDGLLQIGQNRALENAGVKLPDSSRKIGRFNNRKMTFDRIMRRLWIRVCKLNGIQVEEVPEISRKNLNKEDFIRQKIENMRIEAERLNDDARENEKLANEKMKRAEKIYNNLVDIGVNVDKIMRQRMSGKNQNR